MSQHYSNPKRESDPHALPDLEVWQDDAIKCLSCGQVQLPAATSDALCEDYGCQEPIADNYTTNIRNAWWWWTCFPGCMPDGLPNGPFKTEEEALKDARSGAEDDEDEDEPEPSGCSECGSQELSHVDYPHEPGYLDGCGACEDHCHCGRAQGASIEGWAACVFSECSDEEDEDDEESADTKTENREG